MCTVLLPPGDNPIAVNKYIIYPTTDLKNTVFLVSVLLSRFVELNSYTRVSSLIAPLSYMIAKASSCYRRIISTKSPATDTGNISEPRLMS